MSTPEIRSREWESYDLSQDSKFSRFALEEAAEEQPNLMEKWLAMLHQAERLLAKADRDLKHTEASLFVEGKSSNSLEGVKNPTDAFVKAWVLTHPRYIQKQEVRDEAYSNVGKLQHAKVVMEHRKSMIKVESELWICGYYAKMKLPTAAIEKERDSRHMQEASDRIKASVEKRQRRNAENQENEE